MKRAAEDLFVRYRGIFRQGSFLVEVLLGFAVLAGGIFATYLANRYTIIHASNTVTDLILDRVPVVNVNIVFTEGATLFVLALAAITLYRPARIPFVLKSIGLFTLVRSVFMVLTHIAPPVNHSYFDTTSLLYKLSSGDDLFFSAHTGLPFMLAFIFWDRRPIRYFFFASSAIGGVAVLLGHLHYSIDVFSALFIGFGIYYMAKNLFRRDFKRLEEA